MVQPRDFLSDNRQRIYWGSLWSTLLGATILAYFRGIINVLLSLVDIPIAFLGFVATYLGVFAEVVYGALPTIVRASFTGAIPFVRGAGLFGFVVAIVIVLATTYSIAEVVSRVR